MTTEQKGEFISVHGDRIPFAYDPMLDVLILDGTAYSGGLFRMFGTGSVGLEEGAVIRIERREPEGVIVLRRLNNVEEFLQGIKSV
jgi:hypothetical protein